MDTDCFYSECPHHGTHRVTVHMANVMYRLKEEGTIYRAIEHKTMIFACIVHFEAVSRLLVAGHGETCLYLGEEVSAYDTVPPPSPEQRHEMLWEGAWHRTAEAALAEFMEHHN